MLGPAEDGGYYCIGLKSPHARLFADIAWSTEQVLARTLECAHETGLNTAILPDGVVRRRRFGVAAPSD